MAAVENVVRLAEFRRRKARVQRAVARPEAGAQYFCLRCEAEEFRIFASGNVHCARCGSMIRNIRALPRDPAAS